MVPVRVNGAIWWNRSPVTVTVRKLFEGESAFVCYGGVCGLGFEIEMKFKPTG